MGGGERTAMWWRCQWCGCVATANVETEDMQRALSASSVDVCAVCGHGPIEVTVRSSGGGPCGTIAGGKWFDSE